MVIFLPSTTMKSSPASTVCLFLQLPYRTRKLFPGHDGCTDAIAHVTKRNCLSLGTIFVRIYIIVSYLAFYLIALETHIVYGLKYLNLIDLPVKLCRFAVDRRQDPPDGRWCRGGVKQAKSPHTSSMISFIRSPPNAAPQLPCGAVLYHDISILAWMLLRTLCHSNIRLRRCQGNQIIGLGLSLPNSGI